MLKDEVEFNSGDKDFTLTPVKEKLHPELENLQNQIDEVKREFNEKVNSRRGELMARTEVEFMIDD